MYNLTTFNLILKDGSSINSENTEWKSISVEKRVKYQEGNKTVFVCNLPASKIKITAGELETEMDIPEGCEIYKANRGQATFVQGKAEQNLVAVCVGIVKDNEVIEERVVNFYENIVTGWRK